MLFKAVSGQGIPLEMSREGHRRRASRLCSRRKKSQLFPWHAHTSNAVNDYLMLNRHTNKQKCVDLCREARGRFGAKVAKTSSSA
ncbi:Unknown protein sequence [Pseudomonas amygdali pv. sesami]|nr:Unknown protein sequence [Pseudomonas amygdali pv. sesami]